MCRTRLEQSISKKNHPGLTAEISGLVVSSENPWLSASPDRVVHDRVFTPPKGLVEVKTPFSVKGMTIEEACSRSKSFCLEKTERDGSVVFSLKKWHDYSYQIQCQMYCCDVSWCDFVVRTENDLHVERIFRNTEWWMEQLPKL